MAKEDNPTPVLNYAGKDSVRLATPWYVIAAGIFLCFPACGAIWHAGYWVWAWTQDSQIYRQTASPGVVVLLVGTIATIPTVLAYGAIIRRSFRYAELLWQLGAVPAILLTIASGIAVSIRGMPRSSSSRYDLAIVILPATIAWFIVISMHKWSHVLSCKEKRGK